MSKLIKSRIVRILLIFLFSFTVYKFYVNYQHINQLKKRIEGLENAVILAEDDKIELQEELKNIDNPEYIEKIARDELGLVKPGELLLIPVEEEENKK